MTTEISTLLVKEHKDLSQMFIDKVISLSRLDEKEITEYGVSTRWSNTETLQFKVNGMTVKLQVEQ